MRIYDNDTNDISKIIGNNDLTYCESNIIKELTKQSAAIKAGDAGSTINKQKLEAAIKNQCKKAQSTLINEEAKSYDIVGDIPRPVYTGPFKKDKDGNIAGKTEMCTKIDQMEGRCLPLTYYVPDNYQEPNKDKDIIDLRPGDLLTSYGKADMVSDDRIWKAAQGGTTGAAALGAKIVKGKAVAALAGGTGFIINTITKLSNDWIKENDPPNPGLVWYTPEYQNKYYPNDINTTIDNLDSAWIQPTSQLIYGGGYCSQEMRTSGNCLPLGSNYVIPAGKYENGKIVVGDTVVLLDKESTITSTGKSNLFFKSVGRSVTYSQIAYIINRKEINNILDIKVGDKNIVFKGINKYEKATIIKNDYKNVNIEYNGLQKKIGKDVIKGQLFIQKDMTFPLLEIRPEQPINRIVTYSGGSSSKKYKYGIISFNGLTNIFEIHSIYVPPPDITGFYFIIADTFIRDKKVGTKTKFVVQPTNVKYYSNYIDEYTFDLTYDETFIGDGGKKYWTYTDTVSKKKYQWNNDWWYKKSARSRQSPPSKISCVKDENVFYSDGNNKKKFLYEFDILTLKKMKRDTSAMVLNHIDMREEERSVLIDNRYIEQYPTGSITYRLTNKILKKPSLSVVKDMFKNPLKSNKNNVRIDITLDITLKNKIFKIYLNSLQDTSPKAVNRLKYKYIAHPLKNVPLSSLLFVYSEGQPVVHIKTTTSTSNVNSNYKIIYIDETTNKVYLKNKDKKKCSIYGNSVSIGDILYQKSKLKKDGKVLPFPPKEGIVEVSENSYDGTFNYKTYDFSQPATKNKEGKLNEYIKLIVKNRSTIRASSNKTLSDRYIYMENIPDKKSWGNIRGVLPSLAGDVSDLISVPLKQLGFDASKMEATKWGETTKKIGTSKQIEPTNRYIFLHYLMEREWWLQKIVEEGTKGPFTNLMESHITNMKKEGITLDSVTKQKQNYTLLASNCKQISGISDYPVSYCARIYYTEQLKGGSDDDKYTRGVPVITEEEYQKIGVSDDWKKISKSTDFDATLTAAGKTAVIAAAKKKNDIYLNISKTISAFILPMATTTINIRQQDINYEATTGYFYQYKKNLTQSRKIKGFFKESFTDKIDNNSYKITDVLILLLIILIGIIIYAYINGYTNIK